MDFKPACWVGIYYNLKMLRFIVNASTTGLGGATGSYIMLAPDGLTLTVVKMGAFLMKHRW
jgi:hypothetical protein